MIQTVTTILTFEVTCDLILVYCEHFSRLVHSLLSVVQPLYEIRKLTSFEKLGDFYDREDQACNKLTGLSGGLGSG